MGTVLNNTENPFSLQDEEYKRHDDKEPYGTLREPLKNPKILRGNTEEP